MTFGIKHMGNQLDDGPLALRFCLVVYLDFILKLAAMRQRGAALRFYIFNKWQLVLCSLQDKMIKLSLLKFYVHYISTIAT